MKGRNLLTALALAALLSGCGAGSIPRESGPPPSAMLSSEPEAVPSPTPDPGLEPSSALGPSESPNPELRYQTTASYDPETSIQRTTLDAQGYCLSVYFEVPVFEEVSAGYQKINAFFEELTERFFSPDNERLTAAWGYATDPASLTTQEAPFFYERPAAVGARTDRLVSVTIGYQWMMGGVLDYGSDSYTFRTDTGELVGLADLVDKDGEELLELIFTTLKERVSRDEQDYGGSSIDLDRLKDCGLDDFEFAVAEDGTILLLFDKYEAADGAYGGFDLALPITLNPNFK